MTASIGALSGAASYSSPVAARRSETVETKENDHDADDRASASAASPSKSVNLNGQTTGTILHQLA